MYKYSLYYINMSIVDYFEFIYLISNFELKSRLCDPLYLKKNYNYTNPFFSSLSSCSKYLSTWSNNSILTCPNLTFNHIINNAVNGFQMVISGISSIRNLQLTWEQLLFFSKQIKQISWWEADCVSSLSNFASLVNFRFIGLKHIEVRIIRICTKRFIKRKLSKLAYVRKDCLAIDFL